MRPVTLSSPASNRQEDIIAWLVQAVRTIEQASRDDRAAIADSYTQTGTNTVTRVINVTSPTTANVAAVLATFLNDTKNRGVNRTAPT
jgi:hypothetical protein